MLCVLKINPKIYLHKINKQWKLLRVAALLQILWLAIVRKAQLWLKTNDMREKPVVKKFPACSVCELSPSKLKKCRAQSGTIQSWTDVADWCQSPYISRGQTMFRHQELYERLCNLSIIIMITALLNIQSDIQCFSQDYETILVGPQSESLGKSRGIFLRQIHNSAT